MSLAHPMIEPQIASRACTGYFFGGDDKYVASLYSNRIVFKPIDEDTHLIPSDSNEDVVISIPQPPMTLGNAEQDILPNFGGVFFAVGRNHDMLAIQFKSALVILSVNAVDQVLELQGCWGSSKLKDATRLHKASSSVSSANYVEHHHPHMPKMRRPGLSPRNSGSSIQTLGSLKSNGNSKPADDTASISRSSLTPHLPGHHFYQHHHSTGDGSDGSLSGNPSAVSSQTSSTRSGMAICAELPRPKASPDGTQIFVVTKNKYQTLHLILLSSFGQEVIKMEVDYFNVSTLGWISDELVYIVYLNQNFHKKFQTFRLTNKMKTSGVFGMGRKSAKPSFTPETNIRLAIDFLPSLPDTCGGPDLAFKDYVSLGTKSGGYVRVNYKSSSWEPVLNARNVIGAVWSDDRAIVVQSSISKTSPWEPSQLSYSMISESAVHALKVDPRVSACLCSKHNIDSDNRYALKLLYMGDGIILDYKRNPFHAFQFRKGRNVEAPLTSLPWRGPGIGKPIFSDPVEIPQSSKITEDFLVKTEFASYTRDPNGDDTHVCKIMDRKTILSVPIGRPRLLKLLYRDIKAVWAVYENPAEIRVSDESHSKPTKMRNKASYVFPRPYMEWRFGQILTAFRNVLIVNMVHEEKWATFLVSFVNSTHKTNPTPPQVSLSSSSESPEAPPTLLRTPGNACKINLQIFDKVHFGFSRQFKLLVSSYGQYRLEQVQTRIVPTAMDENENFAFFTELDGPLDGMYLAGLTTPPPKPTPTSTPGYSPGAVSVNSSRSSASPEGTINGTSPGSSNTPLTVSDAKIAHVLTVESPDATSGSTLALAHKDYSKSASWIFDSNGKEFRELTVQDIPAARVGKTKHCERVFKAHQSLSNVHTYELSPDFDKKQFAENSSNNQFRPLPELDALITRGIGYGLDAEVYLKTPDAGYLAIFRIQNKRLLETLGKLERVVLEKRVGVWLPDESRSSWLNDFQESTMIAGSAFSAFWQLNDEQQADLCQEASVDIELIRKIRPP